MWAAQGMSWEMLLLLMDHAGDLGLSCLLSSGLCQLALGGHGLVEGLVPPRVSVLVAICQLSFLLASLVEVEEGRG